MASFAKQLSLSGYWQLAGLAWLLGIATASCLGGSQFLVVGLLAASVALMLATYRSTPRRRPWLWVAVLFLAGGWRMQLAGWPAQRLLKPAWSEPRTVRVAAETEVRQGRQRLRLSLPEGQIMLAWAPAWPRYRPGQALSVICQPAPAPYDLSWYAAKEGIDAVCWRLEILAALPPSDRPPLLFSWRQLLAAKLERGLRSPASGLAQAMLLGMDWQVGPELNQIFARAGTNHIISISGLHLTVLVWLLLQVLLMLGWRRTVLWRPAALVLGFYVLLVGAPPAALRSALMSLIVLIAAARGRLPQAGPSLLWAACLLTAVNPYLLRGDIGFQLSFAAVAGLIYLAPRLYDYWPAAWRRRASWLGMALAASIAAQLSTWPLVAFYFGQLAWLAPLANLWSVPLSEVALLAAGAVLALPAAWWWLAWPAQALLDLLIASNAWLASWPWSAGSCQPPLSFVAAYYGLLLVWLYRQRQRN